MALCRRREQVYTFKEYFAIRELEKQNESLSLLEKVIAHIKRNKGKYLCLVFIIAIMLFSYTPERIVEVFLSAIPQAPKGLDRNKLEIFNDITITMLLKVYMVICMGGVAVETVASGWQNEKKFSATVVKYAICYGGGLLCIAILNMLRMML